MQQVRSERILLGICDNGDIGGIRELFALLADRDWLDDANKSIGQFWRRKNAGRHGLILETKGDDPAG